MVHARVDVKSTPMNGKHVCLLWKVTHRKLISCMSERISMQKNESYSEFLWDFVYHYLNSLGKSRWKMEFVLYVRQLTWISFYWQQHVLSASWCLCSIEQVQDKRFDHRGILGNFLQSLCRGVYNFVYFVGMIIVWNSVVRKRKIKCLNM